MQWKRKAAAGCLMVVFCLFSGCQRKDQTEDFLLLPVESPVSAAAESEEKETSLPEEAAKEIPSPAPVTVHICGAVKVPGVYILEQGSRIYQAVELAGGFSEQAGQDALNQAQLLADGMKVYVPTMEEAEALRETKEEAPEWIMLDEGDGGAGSAANASQDLSLSSQAQGLVNINTANEAQLCTLPGVGSSKAGSIIRYREAHGAFQRIEDIMNVEGIKDGLFNKIKDSITV